MFFINIKFYNVLASRWCYYTKFVFSINIPDFDALCSNMFRPQDGAVILSLSEVIVEFQYKVPDSNALRSSIIRCHPQDGGLEF